MYSHFVSCLIELLSDAFVARTIPMGSAFKKYNIPWIKNEF